MGCSGSAVPGEASRQSEWPSRGWLVGASPLVTLTKRGSVEGSGVGLGWTGTGGQGRRDRGYWLRCTWVYSSGDTSGGHDSEGGHSWCVRGGDQTRCSTPYRAQNAPPHRVTQPHVSVVLRLRTPDLTRGTLSTYRSVIYRSSLWSGFSTKGLFGARGNPGHVQGRIWVVTTREEDPAI